MAAEIREQSVYTSTNKEWTVGKTDNEYRKSSVSKKRTQKVKKIKKLGYNFREISNQLLRACKSMNASQVLCRAKGKVGVLKRCLATGDYDLNEVRAAIIHAQKMVDCAKLKVRNMQAEEQAGREQEKKRTVSYRQQQALYKEAKVRELEQQAERKASQLRQKEAIETAALERERQKHRSDEYGKIRKADEEYILARHKNSREEKRQDYGGVSVELSLSAIQMSEMKRLEMQLQFEKQQLARQQAQAQAANQGSGQTVSMDSTGNAASMSEGGSAGAAAAVDISM